VNPMSWADLARARFAMPQVLPVPLRYASVTFETIGDARLREKVVDYLRRFEELGPLGIAPALIGAAREFKTVAAVALLKAIWQTHRFPVDYMGCGHLLALEIDKFSDSVRKRLKNWREIPLLLMDDFAAPAPGSFGAAVVLDVCAARFDALLPTIYTANLKLPRSAEFGRVEELYGPLFARRLEDGAKGFTVLVD